MSPKMRTPAAVMLAGLLVMAGSALAQAQPAVTVLPGLPSAAAGLQALEQDPQVLQARALADAAVHGAAMLQKGPYEWTVSSQGQRRQAESGAAVREWQAQLERTWRWPGKAELDERLAQSTQALARVQWQLAQREAALRLLEAWLDAQFSRQLVDLMAQQVAVVQGNQRAVAQRHRAGDAAQLDVRLAEVDGLEVQRQHSAAQAVAAKAQAVVTTRYPSLQGVERVPLPALTHWPEAPPQSATSLWALQPTAQAAQLQLELSRHLAQRVRADRRPDPTLGVFTASEAGGRERITGLSLSVPLSGSYREQAALQALQQANAAQAQWEQQRQEGVLQATQWALDDQGASERWLQAQTAAAAMTEAARLTQRAYAAGEGTVHQLLQARRQALQAQQAELEARAEALKARGRRLIHTGVWWAMP